MKHKYIIPNWIAPIKIAIKCFFIFIVRKKGTIVLKSTYAGAIQIDLSYFVVNEITIVGSRCGPFEPALNLLNRGMVKLPEIELWELKDYEKAFESKAFKTGFQF